MKQFHTVIYPDRITWRASDTVRNQIVRNRAAIQTTNIMRSTLNFLAFVRATR